MGSLFIASGGDTTERLVSMPIKIKQGSLYTVKGFLKTKATVDTKDRDGFVRMDFYKNIGEARIGNLGKSVAISPRAFKTGEWIEEQASLAAPMDAQYLVISFQRKGFIGGPIYLDDVELFESVNSPKEPFKELPYIKPSIPLESIYYNSFL